MKNKKILIVDDHPVVFQGLAMVLKEEQDIELCGISERADETLSLVEELRPHMVITDIAIKGSMNGIALTKELRSRFSAVLVLVLSMHDELVYAERALRAGARGYVMKSEFSQVIIKAIRKIFSGSIYLSENVALRVIDGVFTGNSRGGEDFVSKLSDRELEILQLIGEGTRISDIAGKLKLSIKTIDTHRTRIREKLGLSDNTQVFQFAIDWQHNKPVMSL